MIVITAAAKFILAIALLLGGIRSVSISLRQITGGMLHDLLKTYTSTPFKGFLLGVIATVFLQSSSIVTVMVVGFINGGFKFNTGTCYSSRCKPGNDRYLQFFRWKPEI